MFYFGFCSNLKLKVNNWCIRKISTYSHITKWLAWEDNNGWHCNRTSSCCPTNISEKTRDCRIYYHSSEGFVLSPEGFCYVLLVPGRGCVIPVLIFTARRCPHDGGHVYTILLLVSWRFASCPLVGPSQVVAKSGKPKIPFIKRSKRGGNRTCKYKFYCHCLSKLTKRTKLTGADPGFSERGFRQTSAYII